ncbi:MAG TPA: type II toxin-antitoxin system RelE/ParE family toxin [Candidatus Binataceae bacterium]|nr:type II toxin-antitoxin system RelE/ParE family toxin [Candidatus Binataceae bacterium]
MADPYAIVLDNAAEREFIKLDGSVKPRIAEGIDKLAGDPRPQGYKKIVGEESQYRIRVGDYRIIYEISDATKSVLVKVIRHRKDAYR